MNILIATNLPNVKNGFLSINNKKEDYLSFLQKEFINDDQSTLQTALKALNPNLLATRFILSSYRYLTKPQDFSIKELPRSMQQSSIRQKILSHSLVIPKQTIDEAKINYDHSFFKKTFSDPNVYNYTIDALPSNDSLIIICDTATICDLLNIQSLAVGLYSLGNDHTPIKLTDYSSLMWASIKEGIINTFMNLNATHISISDKTKTDSKLDLEISKKVLSTAAKIGVNLKREENFEFDLRLDGVFNPEKAIQNIHKIRFFPELKAYAEHIIGNKNSGRSYSSSTFLDVSFGANLNLLTLFQGCFSQGYTRKLEIAIEFQSSDK